MKSYWLIIGFCSLTGNMFYPDPGLFETEQEAETFIANNENKTTKYFKRRVRLGRFTSGKRQKQKIVKPDYGLLEIFAAGDDFQFKTGSWKPK